MAYQFRVGQRVKCVKRGRWTHQGHGCFPLVEFPVFGDELTIRSISESGALLFNEVKNPKRNWVEGFLEDDFSPSRFVPIQSTDTQVELLKRIAITPPAKVSVDV